MGKRACAPYFAAGKAKAAPDSVWKAALLTEVGAKGTVGAAVAQDMKAFFQHVDFGMLELRARKHSFPMPLARLAIEAYSMPRWLYTRTGVAAPICPNRG